MTLTLTMKPGIYKNIKKAYQRLRTMVDFCAFKI